MSVNLSIESNISLADLSEATQAGVSVVRTAHVGNARGYNLAVAASGIPMQLVDHTIVAQRPGERGDNNYFPGSIITEEGIQPLELDRYGGLALQTRALDTQTGTQRYIDELHTDTLRQAFPDTPISTNTEYIRRREAVSGEVARIALAEMPELFTRVVEADGNVRKRNFGSFAPLADTYGILQLNDDPHTGRGLLLPNIADIVLGFTVEALEHGGDTQLHLSGPDFCHYAKDATFQGQVNELYESVRQRASFGRRLPESLHVKIVPATAARFVAADGREATMTKLFDALAAESALNDDKRNFFATHQGKTSESADFLVAARERQAIINREVGECVLQASGLFVGQQDAPFLSQHDVIAAGGLHVQAENQSMTMHELDVLVRRLERSRVAALKGQDNA